MKWLLCFLLFIGGQVFLPLQASVIYKEVNELNKTDFTIPNPVGVQDIKLKVKTGTINMLVINTDDYLESVVLTKNFDELSYLECTDIIDETNSYNVDGNEYDLNSIAGKEVVVGFRFPTVGNSFHYGWMKLKVSDSGDSFDFIEYAYEDLVDTQIEACDVGFVSTNQIQYSQMAIYPNPAQEYIRIVNDSNTYWSKAEIFNAQGILQKQVSDEKEIYIGDLEKGMYQFIYYDGGRVVGVSNFFKI